LEKRKKGVGETIGGKKGGLQIEGPSTFSLKGFEEEKNGVSYLVEK